MLPGGAKFRDLSELRALLVEPPDNFVEAVTEKLLTYALGRGLEYSDRPVVRKIAHAAKAQGNRWSAIVSGIVTSVPFQMREVPAAPKAVASAAQPGKGQQR